MFTHRDAITITGTHTHTHTHKFSRCERLEQCHHCVIVDGWPRQDMFAWSAHYIAFFPCMYSPDLECKKKQTPLYNAVVGQHGDIVALLIDRGANPSAVTDSGYTPLHYSSRFVTHVLIMSMSHVWPYTPLHYSSRFVTHVLIMAMSHVWPYT